MSLWTTAHVIGCEHRALEASAELTETGLLANIPYVVVTGGDMPCGRMLRLRTFFGYSEWRGKWSDGDSGWTNQLRQLMHFRADANDGTFWMAFDDFCSWFNVLFVCRRADDRWTRMTVRSRWGDGTAGGCCPNYTSWRTNPQWLLKLRPGAEPTRLVITLTLPVPPTASAGDGSDKAVTIQLLRGNGGGDMRRRRLTLHEEADVVLPSEPRYSRRVVVDCTLDPTEDDVPYVLMPCTFEPGQQSAFTLVVRSDANDDDGQPAFSFEPVRPRDDWISKSVGGAWADVSGGGGSPGSEGFLTNPAFALHVKTRGRFFVFVDQTGLEGGAPADMAYPEVGVALTLGDGSTTMPAEPHHAPAEARDGVAFECVLEAAGLPYQVLPYLADPAAALANHPRLGYRLSVYSDVAFELADPTDDKCKPDCTYDCKDCPMFDVYERLHRLEKGLDRHMKYLASLQF